MKFDPTILFPKFWKAKRIYEVLNFIYFEITRFKRKGLNETFQSFEIYKNINNNTAIVSYDNLPDYSNCSKCFILLI